MEYYHYYYCYCYYYYSSHPTTSQRMETSPIQMMDCIMVDNMLLTRHIEPLYTTHKERDGQPWGYYYYYYYY